MGAASGRHGSIAAVVVAVAALLVLAVWLEAGRVAFENSAAVVLDLRT
jgi:hypothetical protein